MSSTQWRQTQARYDQHGTESCRTCPLPAFTSQRTHKLTLKPGHHILDICASTQLRERSHPRAFFEW
eukprot:9097387-Pyramimonas_sp.AAC.1